MTEAIQFVTLAGVLVTFVSLGWKIGRLEGKVDQIEKRLDRLERLLDPKKGGEKCERS